MATLATVGGIQTWQRVRQIGFLCRSTARVGTGALQWLVRFRGGLSPSLREGKRQQRFEANCIVGGLGQRHIGPALIASRRRSYCSADCRDQVLPITRWEVVSRAGVTDVFLRDRVASSAIGSPGSPFNGPAVVS